MFTWNEVNRLAITLQEEFFISELEAIESAFNYLRDMELMLDENGEFIHD